MGKIQLACCGLATSAFILAAMLITNLADRLTPQAQAELVVNKETLTLLTTATSSDEEALFVLDGLSEKLLIYRLDITSKELELAGAADLPKIFQGGGGGAGGRTAR